MEEKDTPAEINVMHDKQEAMTVSVSKGRLIISYLWKFLLTCLCGVIIINMSFYYYLAAYPVTWEQDHNCNWADYVLPAWHSLLELNQPVDNLILGDSGAYCDILGGIVSDRLGGKTIQLGNNIASGLLMDGWMLQEYINSKGVPRNVILLRSNSGYGFSHNLEFLSMLPLKWAFWKDYGLEPDWQYGELEDLFIRKYIVIYSNSDVLSARLLNPLTLFSHPYKKYDISTAYSGGAKPDPQEIENMIKNRIGWIYGPFNPSEDSKNALQFTSDLAKKYGFQLYIVYGPENDVMFQDVKRVERVAAMQKFVSQYTDDKFVHLIPGSPIIFTAEQMQNPNHLSPDAACEYTQLITDSIIEIQNKDVKNQVTQPKIVSTSLDKDTYIVKEKAIVNIDLINNTGETAAGTVSCLVKPAGSDDSKWIARATAVNFRLDANNKSKIELIIDKGELTIPGVYDVVIYLLTPSNKLVKETKYTLEQKLIVNALP
jgi:hypothetical protein